MKTATIYRVEACSSIMAGIPQDERVVFSYLVEAECQKGSDNVLLRITREGEYVVEVAVSHDEWKTFVKAVDSEA